MRPYECAKEIYETLNSKGKKWTLIDALKPDILKGLSDSEKMKVSQIWYEILSLIDTMEAEGLKTKSSGETSKSLVYKWLVQCSSFSSYKDINGNQIDYLKNSFDINNDHYNEDGYTFRNFIKRLKETSSILSFFEESKIICNIIIDILKERKKKYKILFGISNYSHIPSLVLARSKNNSEELESYITRFFISHYLYKGVGNKEFSGNLRQLSHQIKIGDINEVSKLYKKLMSSEKKEEIKNNFKELSYRDRKTTNILFHMDCFLSQKCGGGTNGEFSYNNRINRFGSDLTLEHIHSQKNVSSYKGKIGIDSIENLTLLTNNENSKLSKSGLDTKKDVYSISNFIITYGLFNHSRESITRGKVVQQHVKYPKNFSDTTFNSMNNKNSKDGYIESCFDKDFFEERIKDLTNLFLESIDA